jgi:hypothetical protein
MPITWRNVSGPSLADASRPLEVAQRSLLGGLDAFNSALKGVEATDAANWQQQKQNNTNDFLNKLYEAQTADQLTRMNGNGQLNQLLNNFGAQIDQAAARQALDQRMGVLQNRDVQNITYKNTMLDEAQQEDVKRIGLLTLTDPKAAAAELAANPQLRKAVELAQGIDTRQEVLKKRGWDEEMHPLDVQAKKADITYKGAQTGLANAQAEHARATAERDRAYIDFLKAGGSLNADGTPNNSGNSAAVKQIDKAWEEMLKHSSYDKGDYSTAAGQEFLAKELRERKIPEGQISDIMYNLSKYYSKGAPVGFDEKTGQPMRVPLPLSTVLQAVDRSSDNPLAIGWSRRGDDVVNILDSMFGVDSSGKKSSRGDNYRADLVQELAAINEMRAQRDARLANAAVPTLLEQSTNPETWKKAPPKGRSIMFPKPR